MSKELEDKLREKTEACYKAQADWEDAKARVWLAKLVEELTNLIYKAEQAITDPEVPRSFTVQRFKRTIERLPQNVEYLVTNVCNPQS